MPPQQVERIRANLRLRDGGLEGARQTFVRLPGPLALSLGPEQRSDQVRDDAVAEVRQIQIVESVPPGAVALPKLKPPGTGLTRLPKLVSQRPHASGCDGDFSTTSVGTEIRFFSELE